MNNSIIEQLKTDFATYLNNLGHSEKTKLGYLKVLTLYLNWLIDNRLSYQSMSYEKLLGFVKQERAKGHKVNTINQKLFVVRKFYTSLLPSYVDDPIILSTIQSLEALKLRGGTRHMLHDLLSEEQLITIYAACPNETMGQVRNKCVLGMMIYQALHAGDICRIKLTDLNLEKASVYIASTGRSNARNLSLHASQVHQLQKYLLGVRPGLLNYSERGVSEYLMIGKNGSRGAQNLRGSLAGLYQKLLKDHPELQHINQIRSSVIRHWLKKENIREVQHKLGHRYLSSTQEYLEGDIESLQQQIDRLHPLNDT